MKAERLFKVKQKMFKKTINYFKNAKTELTKVTWPTKKEAARLTVVVIALSIVFAIIIGLLDVLFSYLIRLVIESQ